ncbi:MAG: hypothetical protein EXS05_24600 [Planctomycetaceae bacterium]|nr:hypothetical protein [Planctomycetaceae bacterium]
MRVAFSKPRRAGVIVLVAACLAAAPVYAGYQWQKLTCHLPNIDKNGNFSQYVGVSTSTVGRSFALLNA